MIHVKYAIYILMSSFFSLICLNVILTWFPAVYKFKFFRGLRKIGDAYMEPFHGILVLGMFDFTPIIGIVLFEFLIKIYLYLAF